MPDLTGIRLDTADLADGSGWRVASTNLADEFSRDGVSIEVSYTAGDDVVGAVKRGPDDQPEVVDVTTVDKHDLIRFWLTGRPAALAGLSWAELLQGLEIKFDGTNPWVPQEFCEAVEDLAGKVFLRRILELVHSTIQLPAMGDYCHLCFGQYPGGTLFVYPFMRRFPPYKFKLNTGELMVAGCWKSNFKGVTGHPGFAELAAVSSGGSNGVG
ncbi:hypothetical protein KIH27_12150, partial [Mycobacterium sp. M1]